MTPEEKIWYAINRFCRKDGWPVSRIAAELGETEQWVIRLTRAKRLKRHREYKRASAKGLAYQPEFRDRVAPLYGLRDAPSVDEIARRLGVGSSQITRCVKHFGLKRHPEYEAGWRKIAGRRANAKSTIARGGFVFTPEQDALLIKHFTGPEALPTAEIAVICGVQQHNVRRRARSLGLQRDPQWEALREERRWKSMFAANMERQAAAEEDKVYRATMDDDWPPHRFEDNPAVAKRNREAFNPSPRFRASWANTGRTYGSSMEDL